MTWLSRLRALILAERAPTLQELAQLRQVPVAEALVSEVLPLLDAIHWLQGQGAKVLRNRYPSWLSAPAWMLGHRLTIARRPYGKVLIIAPGNYPLFLAGVQALQALVAGNDVILKPAPGAEAPLQRLQRWLQASGLPCQRLTLLDSNPQQVAEQLQRGVDLVVLTGSEETGRQVLPQCSQRLVPSIAELSGHDLVILAPDGDPALALRALRWASQLNHGRTCMRPRRLWLPPGQSKPEIELELEIAHYQDLEQVVTWLGQDPHGLGISLFAGPPSLEVLLPACRSGFVTVNDILAPTADPRAPFGGRGRSGYGTTRGAEGLLAMTYPQAILSNRGPRFYLARPTGVEGSLLEHYALLSHGSGRQRLQGLLGLSWDSFRWLLRQLAGSNPR